MEAVGNEYSMNRFYDPSQGKSDVNAKEYGYYVAD